MAVFIKNGVKMNVEQAVQCSAFINSGWKEVSPEAPKEEKEEEVDLSTITPDSIDNLEWGQLKSVAKAMGINSKGMKQEELKAAMLERLAVKEA